MEKETEEEVINVEIPKERVDWLVDASLEDVIDDMTVRAGTSPIDGTMDKSMKVEEACLQWVREGAQRRGIPLEGSEAITLAKLSVFMATEFTIAEEKADREGKKDYTIRVRAVEEE